MPLRIIPRLSKGRGYCLCVCTGFYGGAIDRNIRRCISLLFVIKKAHGMGAGHFAQHAFGQRVGLGVVADVDIKAIHHIEVRVGKELLHGQVAHLGRYIAGHKGLEIGCRRKRLGIGQRGWRGSFCSGPSAFCGGGGGASCHGGWGRR
ncbi:hypothetical protein D3C72_1739700 [compost metagenome]